jgi:hypothetical protein
MKLRVYIFILLFTVSPCVVFASSTTGAVNSVDRYAWSENAGWIDFGTATGNVTVTDGALTGYAYGENTGWISLNCSNTASCASNAYAVTNNGNGYLSGYAWSENTGWINFNPSGAGVTISSSGIFSGYAYSENLGWINFTTDHPVTTDWRPVADRVLPTPPATSSGSGYVSISSPISIPVIVTSPVSEKNLDIGSSGSHVQTLQTYLNSHGFTVSLTGPGSPGHETTHFGILTRKALAKFQLANGIQPSLGYFGPITKAFINNHH